MASDAFAGYTSIVEPTRPSRSGRAPSRSSSPNRPAPAAPSGYDALEAPARPRTPVPAGRKPTARKPVASKPATARPTAPRPVATKPVMAKPRLAAKPLYQARPAPPAAAPVLGGATPPMTALELELAEFLLRVAARGQLLISQVDPRLHLPVREREPMARALNVVVEQASEAFYDLTGRHPTQVTAAELARQRPADWTKCRPNFTWIVRPSE